MTAKSDMLSSEGGSNALARTQYTQQGQAALDELFNTVAAIELSTSNLLK